MTNVLIWVGIALTVIGWLALAWQASKRLAAKSELDKFSQKKDSMRLNRNYCWAIIITGVMLLLIAIII